MMQPQVVDAASQLQMLQQQQLQQQQLQQLRPGLMPGMVPGLPMQQLVPAVSSVGMIPGMTVPGIPGLAAQPQLLARPQMIGIPGAQQEVLTSSLEDTTSVTCARSSVSTLKFLR